MPTQITPPPPEPMAKPHLTKKLTQKQKIIAYMCINKNKQWWLAKDFMQDGMGEFYVGYEATARLAELVKPNPGIFDTRQEGRFRAVRLRFDQGSEWWQDAPKDIKLMVQRYYKK